MHRRSGPGAWAGAETDSDRVRAIERPDSTISGSAAIRRTGGDPPPAQRPRAIALAAWRPFVKPIGIRRIDCRVYVGKDGAFATLPRKPQVDEGGRRTDFNAKMAFAPILKRRSPRFDIAQRASLERRRPTGGRR